MPSVKTCTRFLLRLCCLVLLSNVTLVIFVPDTALTCQALSKSPSSSSRRDWLLQQAPLGSVVAYAYGRAGYNVWQNLGLRHPAAHEAHVQSTITRAFLLAAEAKKKRTATASTTATMTINNNNISSNNDNTNRFRVLEVGMGSDCRLVRRGLYQEALAKVHEQHGIQQVEIVGVDVQPPDDTTLTLARHALDDTLPTGLSVKLDALQHSITDRLPISDGAFDAIVCCLTLCSVDDPVAAVSEMKRLLRPHGGTLGYVEHVAVNADEARQQVLPYGFLERQQLWLDPWQQQVADNCHLHRYTEQTLQDVLSLPPPSSTTLVQHERFLVDAMWPVSMQACGVYQL